MTQNANFPDFRNFFGKSGRVTFLRLWSPNFMQKFRKIVRAVSEKNWLPTTNYQVTVVILWDLGKVPTGPKCEEFADKHLYKKVWVKKGP